MPARACRISFSELEALTLRIILEVHGNQGRHAEATQVFLSYLSARALGRHHDHGEIFADLHAFFDDVEAVGVRQTRALLHQWHDRLDHVGVLLVRR